MPLTEHQALDAARQFLLRVRRTLPYPLLEAPVEHRHVQSAQPPRVFPDSPPIGSAFWEFDFMFDVPGRMVDPSGVRVFVDSITGAAALFSPR
jgi:hypothetical protein